MEDLQNNLSIGFLAFGGYLALFNLWSYSFLILGRNPPSSAIPIVGGLLLVWGAMLSSNETLQTYALLGLIIDVTCIPGLVVALFSSLRKN